MRADSGLELGRTASGVGAAMVLKQSTNSGHATSSSPTDCQIDAAGNVTVGTQVVDAYDLSTGVTQRVRAVNSRSYYDADQRLRVFQEYDTNFSSNKGSGVWEEYRYDPLGRRVLVRTRRENPLCYGDAKTCISSVTLFVWSGDQILGERKDAEGSYASQAGGRVSYAHAGGIDRPLAIWKQGWAPSSRTRTGGASSPWARTPAASRATARSIRPAGACR